MNSSFHRNSQVMMIVLEVVDQVRQMMMMTKMVIKIAKRKRIDVQPVVKRLD